MVIKEIDESNYFINFGDEDVAIIVNIVLFIIENLEEELSTRTGFSNEEYQSLVQKLKSPAAASFSIEELAMMRQALNEVCNGIPEAQMEDLVRLALPKAEEIFRILGEPVHKHFG
jgi:tRNA C32,U32 (ribose-2'-O)-methylase TrmJ